MTLSEQLAEARSAYHQILVGNKAVKIKKDGREVEFSRVNLAELRNYINDLEAQVGLSRRRRPAGVGL